MSDSNIAKATYCAVTRLDTTKHDHLCTVRLLEGHPEGIAQKCGRLAEYEVKHPVIVASLVCGAHLEHEVDALLRLADHYEGRVHV